MRPVKLITELMQVNLDTNLIRNETVTFVNKAASKPKKFRYIPPLVNFNTLIK